VALQRLAERNYRYFWGVFFGADYDRIMTMAYELGMAGPGRFWMICAGTLLMASSIIPASMDDTVVSTRARKLTTPEAPSCQWHGNFWAHWNGRYAHFYVWPGHLASQNQFS
jgi:hypothetical protein